MFSFVSTLIAATFTLAIFSFLYKENPFYRFAEYMLVGISMGYAIPLAYSNLFIPYLWQPIFLKHQWFYIIPVLVGAGFLFRFSSKYSWLSNYPMAISMAITGMYIPMGMNAGVLVQMRSAMIPWENINNFLIFFGTFTILMYFYFSKEHSGWYGKLSRVGVWYMMIGFGASFGYTVMGRMSLLIGRIQFLVFDFLQADKWFK